MIPTLIGFFLWMSWKRPIGTAYAACGLLGMRDRNQVLRATVARLEHPETHDAGKLIYFYAQTKYPFPADFDPEKMKTNHAQRQAAEALYRAAALALVKADKEYRYGYLIPLKLATGPATGGPDDLFLMEYLFRGHPEFEWIQHCMGVLDRVALPREFEPAMAELLKAKDWSAADAAIRQLIQMDSTKYLPVLRERQGERHETFFSPAAYSNCWTQRRPQPALD